MAYGDWRKQNAEEKHCPVTINDLQGVQKVIAANPEEPRDVAQTWPQASLPLCHTQAVPGRPLGHACEHL